MINNIFFFFLNSKSYIVDEKNFVRKLKRRTNELKLANSQDHLPVFVYVYNYNDNIFNPRNIIINVELINLKWIMLASGIKINCTYCL
jgi:hypothetical protein